jgi:hypothetical protein
MVQLLFPNYRETIPRAAKGPPKGLQHAWRSLGRSGCQTLKRRVGQIVPTQGRFPFYRQLTMALQRDTALPKSLSRARASLCAHSHGPIPMGPSPWLIVLSRSSATVQWGPGKTRKRGRKRSGWGELSPGWIPDRSFNSPIY